VIARVRNERWQLSKTHQRALEENDKDVTKCEEARDRVLEWCVHHNPRSNMEAWRAATTSAKAVTDLLNTTRGNNDFTCTSEMWQMSIRVRDDLLIPMAQKLGEERGQRIWTACMEKEPEAKLCFEGIQASSRHPGLRSWTKMYDMFEVPEALQRELVLLSIMLEQPSFVPLDMLIGEIENPCLFAEVWRAKGAGSGPIHIAGIHTLVAPGNTYATNKGWSIAGRECYEGRMQKSNHGCLHRGAKASTPKVNIQVGIP
jgi:hypothetical protein